MVHGTISTQHQHQCLIHKQKVIATKAETNTEVPFLLRQSSAHKAQTNGRTTKVPQQFDLDRIPV